MSRHDLDFAAHSPADLPDGAPAEGPRIGPNAITRLAEALEEMEGRGVATSIFVSADCMHHLVSPPTKMAPADDVSRLHRALHAALGEWRAAEVSWRAGELTAAYLLANRVPRFAQALLRLMPQGLAARAMARAIGRHAWTFAGGGQFSWSAGESFLLRIERGAISRYLANEEPVCHYYAATFEGVFAAILGPTAKVAETACEASGATACVFQLSW